MSGRVIIALASKNRFCLFAIAACVDTVNALTFFASDNLLFGGVYDALLYAILHKDSHSPRYLVLVQVVDAVHFIHFSAILQ